MVWKKLNLRIHEQKRTITEHKGLRAFFPLLWPIAIVALGSNIRYFVPFIEGYLIARRTSNLKFQGSNQCCGYSFYFLLVFISYVFLFCEKCLLFYNSSSLTFFYLLELFYFTWCLVCTISEYSCF